MRTFGLIVAAALLVPAAVCANPVVNIDWNGCPASNPPSNLTLADGPTPKIVVTGSGFTQAVRGIQIVVSVSHAGMQGLPDSWRYDPAGCNADGFQASYASAGCPSIVGANPISISNFQYDGNTGKATLAYLFLPWTPDPNTTYTLAQFTFDKSNGFRGLGAKADSCGCVERAECLMLYDAKWIDVNSNEIPFTPELVPMVSWEDPYGAACGVADCFDPPPACSNPDPCSLPQPTPATQRTWGSVKSQYR